MVLKNRSFQYGKVALAVSAQYQQLQFVLKVVAICTDTCMSLVQTVHSLLLPDFLSTLISIPSSLVKTIAFFLRQPNASRFELETSNLACGLITGVLTKKC